MVVIKIRFIICYLVNIMLSATVQNSHRQNYSNIEQSHDKHLPKKRSFSLRKLNNPSTLLTYGSEFNLNSQKQLQQEEIINDIYKSPKKRKHTMNSVTKLSPIKQYQTKLKISAESWLVFDYRKDSYKRGWRPADIGQFSGLIRLLLLKVFLQLQKSNKQLKNFNLRVNPKYLKQQVQALKDEKLKRKNKRGLILKQAISRLLSNNTLINIVDLFYALFMTNHDDIVEYGIVFMGYLCHCHVTQTNPISEQNPCHFFQKISQACANAQYFSQYCAQILFPLLEMNSSNFKSDTYTFYTCANDICRLYLSIQDSSLFKQLIKCKELTCKIKYQIGFRYWQNRILELKNKRIDMGSSYQFVGCWKGKKNYTVICHNIKLGILIILEDCKFGMMQCDIRNIEDWVKELMKPVIDMRKTHSKLLPLMRPGFSPKKETQNLIQKQRKISPKRAKFNKIKQQIISQAQQQKQ